MDTRIKFGALVELHMDAMVKNVCAAMRIELYFLSTYRIALAFGVPYFL